MCLGYDEIRKILPHEPPFIYIDRVIEWEKNKRLVAEKNVTGTELFTQTHFPEFAVYPGIYLIESAAQASLLLFKLSWNNISDKYIGVLGGIQYFQFLEMVKPGDRLRIEVTIIKQVDHLAIMKINISSHDGLVARGQISTGLKAI
jgi:3-hydroxyacyl-[acyl-carrier-protein] dehydratase